MDTRVYTDYWMPWECSQWWYL